MTSVVRVSDVRWHAEQFLNQSISTIRMLHNQRITSGRTYQLLLVTGNLRISILPLKRMTAISFYITTTGIIAE
jgi:hypothetical protein